MSPIAIGRRYPWARPWCWSPVRLAVSRWTAGSACLPSHPDVDRVVGVDVVPPRIDLGSAEFVRADIRNPVIAKIIDAADVDTVVHMGVIATPMQAGGRADDEGHQRHRHDAVAGGLPEVGDRCANSW